MTMPIIIGMDHGYGIIKTKGCSFKTSVTAYTKEPPTKSDKCIKYEGKYYEIGGARSTLRKNKTKDETYWILTLAGIAAEITKRKLSHTQNIILAAGLPLAQYSNEKAEFKKYLLRKGEHKFEYGKYKMSITIEDVCIYPQGYSAVIGRIGELKNEPLVHLIDIGSWTVDTVSLVHGVATADSQHSFENGVIKCFNWIAEQIHQKTGKNLTQDQIESVLWNKSLMLQPELKKEIKSLVKVWLAELIGKLYESNFDLTSAPVIFIGGGAYLMKNYCPNKKDFGFADYVMDISANVDGFELACTAMQRKKRK